MSSDITITGGTTSISTTDQQTRTDELLGRVRERIVGNAGNDQIVEGLFLKAAIGVASNLPEDGVMRSFPSGTKMLFQQSNAPTGWTKDTAHNDKALRVVSGSATNGGSVGFTSLLNSGTVRGTVRSRVNGGISNHTLSSAQIPSHKHYIFSQHVGYQPAGDSGDLITRNYAGRHIMGKTINPLEPTVGRTSHVGNNQGHNHDHNISVSSAFSSTTNLDITYVDVIIATKD